MFVQVPSRGEITISGFIFNKLGSKKGDTLFVYDMILHATFQMNQDARLGRSKKSTEIHFSLRNIY